MIKNCKLVDFKEFRDERGALIPLEEKDIGFKINRIYYIYDVPNNFERGFHSHNQLEQILICVHGSVKIRVSTPFEKETVLLDSANKGLYIGPMIWREMYDFSSDAVLLVLASNTYDQNDYIKDKDEYLIKAKEYFGE